MSKIVITVAGTHGEVRPMVALGIALRDEGHEVVMCASPNEEKFIGKFGLPFFSAGYDIQELVIENKEFLGKPITGIKYIGPLMRGFIANQFDNLLEAARGADFIIGSGEQFATSSIAELLNIPYCYICLIVQFIQSKYHPPAMIPWQTMPKWVNEVSWRFNNSFVDYLLRKQINENRKKLKLGPIDTDVMGHMLKPRQVILAMNKELTVIPSDAKLDCEQTAYCHLDEKSDLPPELIKFIEAGEPPIFFGFGSMHVSPEKVNKIVYETIQNTGVRVILSKGWGEIQERDGFKDKLYFTGHIPHERLFPRMAAVVHAGGPGTVYSTARAGAPQIIIPLMGDQYYWAHRVPKLGLSPKSIIKGLNSKNLSAAIKEAISNQGIKDNCKKMEEQLRSVNGVDETLKVIKKNFQI